METGRQCVMCPRSVLRQRRHILQETLLHSSPELAAYILQNGLTQVSHSHCIYLLIYYTYIDNF